MTQCNVNTLAPLAEALGEFPEFTPAVSQLPLMTTPRGIVFSDLPGHSYTSGAHKLTEAFLDYADT